LFTPDIMTVEVGLRIGGKVEVDGEPVDLGSPTTTLRADICNEVGSNTSYVSKIDKIVLVDSSNAEKDSTTSLSYTDNTSQSPPNVVIQGSISITANYTVAKIRLYAGTKLYFETSWSRSVTSGDVVQVRATISVSASGSLSGTVTGSLTGAAYAQHICWAFIGASQRRQIGFYSAVLLTEGLSALWTGTFTRSVDLTNYRVTGDTGVVSPSAEGTAVYLYFKNSGGDVMVTFGLDTSISVTVNTRFQVTFTFTC